MTPLLMAEAGRRPAAASFWSIHAGHVVLLAVWVLVVAGVQLRVTLGKRRAGARRRQPLPRSGWLAGAAATTVASAAVHLSVIGEHFRESALYGTFFVVLAALQLAWAAGLVLRPSRAWLSAGAAASVLVALLWLATRTVGIPLGPAAGELEGVGAPDVLASAAEVVTAALAVAALRVAGRRGPTASRRRPRWPVRNREALVGA